MRVTKTSSLLMDKLGHFFMAAKWFLQILLTKTTLFNSKYLEKQWIPFISGSLAHASENN